MPDTPPPHSTGHPEDEIDLLDLLVVFADNIKLLLAVPIFTGLLGFSAGFLLTPTYESRSVLSVPSTPSKLGEQDVIASYVRAADVLVAAGREAQIGTALTDGNLLKKMETLVNISVGRQDKLITLTTQGATPESAQQLNQVLWRLALSKSIPQASDMARLNTQLTAEKERLTSGLALEASTARALQNGSANESTARLYGELLTSNSKRLERITELEALMEGVTVRSLTQQATLPEEPIKPQKAIIAMVTGLGGGFLTFLFVFARHALRTASRNPEQAEKIRRIREAVGWKT